MLALQNLVGSLHILNAAVRAGADDDLVDLDAPALSGRVGVFGQVRVADGRLERVKVNRDGLLVLGIGVSLVLRPRALAAAREIRLGDCIDREDAVLGTGLDGHIADAEPVLHRQAADALAGKLKALVQRAGYTDFADEVQDDILAGDRLAQSSLQLHLDGGGDLKPCHALCHAGGHIGGADTGGERPYRTVGAGVAVGTDDAVTGGHDALFGQQGMFNAHLAHIVEVENVVLVGKFAALLGLRCALDVLIGDKVIQHNIDAGLIKHRVKPGFFKFIDGDRGRDVIAQHDVELGIDELARCHGCLAAVGR